MALYRIFNFRLIHVMAFEFKFNSELVKALQVDVSCSV